MLGFFDSEEKNIKEAIESGDHSTLPTDVIAKLAANLIVTTKPHLPEYRVTQRLALITA